VNAGPLVTLLLLGVVFYLFLIAPQRRRARHQQQMTSRLEPGTEVMTTAGLFATVRSVGDTDVELEVAPGVVSRYAKGAIARVITPPEDEDEVAGDAADDDTDADPDGVEGTEGTPRRVDDTGTGSGDTEPGGMGTGPRP